MLGRRVCVIIFGVYLTSLVAVTYSQDHIPCEKPPKCHFPRILNSTSCSCDCSYRKSKNPGKYLVYIPHFPVPFIMACPVTLVWNQEECTCLRPKRGTDFPIVAQTQAVQCQSLADVRSNGSNFGNFDGYYSKNENAGEINLEPVEGALVNGSSALFRGISMYLNAFESNDLTGTAFIKLRVRPQDTTNHTDVNNTQVILSDACTDYPEPPMELTYSPFSGNFSLKIRTSTGNDLVINVETCEGVQPSTTGWFEITISILHGDASWSINDVACPQLRGSGSIDKTRCGLTIGGNPIPPDDSEDFYGHIDYVRFIKHCDKEPVV